MKSTATLFMPAVLVLILSVFILNDDSSSKKKKKHKKKISQTEEYIEPTPKNTDSSFLNLPLTDNETYPPEGIQNFILLLKEEESRTINTHTGIHSLTSRVEQYCRNMVSSQGSQSANDSLMRNCFEEIVKATFPEKLEQITIYLQNLIQYRMVLESESNLTDSKANREAALWRKRYELFGYDAAEELYASDRFLKKVEQRITENTSSKKSLDEKIRFLEEEIANVKSLQQNQQDTASEEFIQFGEYFLSSPEVQASLNSMSLKNRNQKLRAIRISVGIPESRLNALEDWDRSRLEEWEKGKRYNKELTTLKSKPDLSKEEYLQKLKQLKESFFGKELAEEIEEEEKKGIDRFAIKPEFFLQ